MRCRVLLFAQLADGVGFNQLELNLAEGATVRDALERLAAEHDSIRAMEGRLAVAVDERYQPLDALLSSGCTIALIPPVSGG